MSVALSPIGGAGAQFFDNNGNPLSGGKLYTYEAGTTTPAVTYTTLAGTTAHPNPIILDAAGRVPGGEIWLTLPDFYKFVLKTSADVSIGNWDNIQGYSSGYIAYAATEVQTATAEQTLFVLTEMFYNPGTNTLAVYIDGVNQVVNNSYVESTSTSVTFMSGLHVGALVKFVNVNVASADATTVNYEPGFVGSVATTVAAKLQQTVSVKDFGAVGDGVTDDTAAIQLALDSGAVIVDFLGLLCKCDEIIVPAGVAAVNLNLLKKTAGGNVVRVNSNCRLTGKITGTGTLSIVERGVYPAANDVTDVTFDLECVDLTYGVHAQPPVSGVAYADAPKRWSGDLRFTDIAGTTGVSEGYGLLLSPAYHCQFNVISKSPNARHVIYISAGASYNQINANINGCTNYAAQIFATSSQPYCEYNTLNLTCFSLTETVAGQSGAIAIVGQANFNTATINMSGGGAVSYAALIEGGSGGPYPAGNKIINSSIYGQFTGADVIRMINADGTIIEGNTFACYAANHVIAMRKVGTNGASNAGFIEGNTINGLGQNVKGIYNECNAQPSWIGPNQIQANGTSLRVDDQSGGYRQGFSRRATFSGTTASIAGVSSGDTTATLLTPIQTTGRRTNVVTTGSSGTYFNSAICLVGVTAPGSETSATFRLYNGAAGAQTFNYEGVVEGD